MWKVVAYDCRIGIVSGSTWKILPVTLWLLLMAVNHKGQRGDSFEGTL